METYKRDLQKRPTKETHTIDLQKRPTQEMYTDSHPHILQGATRKETYKRDLQKRPTQEMYTDSHPCTSDGDLRRRLTKETCKRDLQKRCILTLTRMPQMAQREETLLLESAARENAQGRQRQIVESWVLTLQADLLQVHVRRLIFNLFFFFLF